MNVKNFDSNAVQSNQGDLRISIRVLVHNASKGIAPVWPLDTFIACNPLYGKQSSHFEKVFSELDLINGCQNLNSSLKDVNAHMIKWCSSYFDHGQGLIQMPFRKNGFYAAFLKLSPYDRTLHENQKEKKSFLSKLPNRPEVAIQLCLDKMGISYETRESFIAEQFSFLPGWSGFVKWKTDWQVSVGENEDRSLLCEFMAIRLILTFLLFPDIRNYQLRITKNNNSNHILEKVKSRELNYQKSLLNAMQSSLFELNSDLKTPSAQFVFCIDVRSEPFRRALERQGAYETFGFAGFFGLPIFLETLDSKQLKACCPVLLKPKFKVREVIAEPDFRRVKKNKNGKQFLINLKNMYLNLKHNFSTPFPLAESLGPWCGLGMFLKSLAPKWTQYFLKTIYGFISPSIKAKLDFSLNHSDALQGLSLEEQIQSSDAILRLMGLTKNFSPIVIFCGHGSTTENNPYASALDCGACGGNQGGMNARLFASILNQEEVKKGLVKRGIVIPNNTYFLAAQHNTTTDDVTMYPDLDLPSTFTENLSHIKVHLRQAKFVTNQERQSQLDGLSKPSDISIRSMDWSETRPEWGLARNAAFIVAPRYLTQSIHLEGRCFLHSYYPDDDKGGELLETILTAPMVVAEWINMQYLFSSIDNVSFGSGSKVSHNVVGTIGVMQGNASDLMHGLPLQSIMRSDDELYHEPQRLLTLVYAPKERLTQVIQKHPILQTLFFNQWVNLIVLEPQTKQFFKLDQLRDWLAIQL